MNGKPTKDDRMTFWSSAYLAALSAGRANSACREYADEAVRDLVNREKVEHAAEEEGD